MRVLKWCGICALGLFVLAAGSLAILWISLPSAAGVLREHPGLTRFMVARTAELGLPTQRFQIEWTDIDDMSTSLVCAAMWSEDKYFFQHHGFDWNAISQVFQLRWHGKAAGGGSTISQQLARNLFLTGEPTWWRKFREAVLTTKLEHAATKTEILELYLNVIEWGDGVWGIGPASRAYFDKAPADLNPFEASFLVALIAAPRHALADQNLTRVHDTQRRVLDQLFMAGVISERVRGLASAYADQLHSSLARGIPLRSALDQLGPLPPPQTRPLDQELQRSCGLGQWTEIMTRVLGPKAPKGPFAWWPSAP